MEANETTQNQEEINKTYFMIQSKNPNLTDCQPTILMTELQVSSYSQYTCRFAGNFFCRRHRQNMYPLPPANRQNRQSLKSKN